MDDQILCQIIKRAFETEFAEFRTQINGGFNEPFYKAPVQNEHGEIQFRETFPRSALHEISHWCVAGVKRLKQNDFGYWYAPDGRNSEQQKIFFQLEIKPQSYEFLFCEALDMSFEVSADNLFGEFEGLEEFKTNVKNHIALLKTEGLPERVERFINALKCEKQFSLTN